MVASKHAVQETNGRQVAQADIRVGSVRFGQARVSKVDWVDE